MKRLFLTGPVGCGKSTSIATALSDKLPGAGGLLTVRQRDDTGQAVAYHIQRPDGTGKALFLDCAQMPYRMHLEVFDTWGVELLEEAKQYPYVVLDEIGGVELLCPRFRAALEGLLQSGIPCIGVMKGVGPAGKMIQKLGLGEEYTAAAESLRRWMRDDPETTLYECGRFDPEGLCLASAWVEQYTK